MSTTVKVTKVYIKQLIRELNKYCFSAGSEKYAKDKGIEITPETMRPVFASHEKRIEFGTYANWSYKKAQEIIVKERLKLERAIRSKTLEFEKPYNDYYIFALLRDYADCIAWTMLKHDISAVRNVFLEPKKHSHLDEQNWESIQKSLDHFNKDPNQFALATDLTSFFHIGDLYCLNTKTSVHHLIEVKTGKVNEEILETITSKDLDEFKKKSLALLTKSKDPAKTSKQVSRTLRQYQRATTSLEYGGWGSKKRTHIKTGENVTILEEKREEENWAVAIRDVIKDMEAHDTKYATGWVDYCIFFAYGRKSLTNVDEQFFRFRINEHYDLGLTAEQAQALPVFRLEQMIGTQILKPRSLLFLENFGIERQSKLLAGDEFILVYLHVPAIKYLMKINGYNFELKNMSSVNQKYADKLLSKLFGHNKVPVISVKSDDETFDWAILSGTWQRIIFDFVAPVELINKSNSVIGNSKKIKKRPQSKQGKP